MIQSYPNCSHDMAGSIVMVCSQLWPALINIFMLGNMFFYDICIMTLSNIWEMHPQDAQMQIFYTAGLEGSGSEYLELPP